MKKNANSRDVDILIDELSPWWKKTSKFVRKKEVATWKGALILMFFAGAASALIWSVRSNSLENTLAAPASTLYFTPSTSTVINGSSFSLNAMINPGTNKVTAAALRITYDPAKLALDSITPSSAFSLVLSSASINNTNGTASIDLGVPTTNPSVTSISSIATFNFHAIATATNSSVSFTSGSQAAAENETSDVILTRTGTVLTINPADTTAPTGGSISYTNGYITNTTTNLTVADGTDPSGINTSSRIIQRRSATLSGGTCGSFGSYGAVTTTGTYPNFTDSTIASGNCYQYQYLISDNANPANQASYTSLNTLKVDNTAPTGGSISYSNGYVTSASLTVADGNDAVSAINASSRIIQRRSATLSGGACGSFGSYSTVLTTGTYPNFIDATIANGNCYQYQYQISDNAGMQATYTTTNVLKMDTAAPTGGSISFTNGYITNTTGNITVADGNDSSGINNSTRIIQRRSAALSGGSCGSYGSFASVTTTGTYPNFSDSTIVSGNCYQYQYQISDNAAPANQATYTSSSVLKVDTSAPTGGSITYTNGLINKSTNLTLSDGSDSVSGINTTSRIIQRRSAVMADGICGAFGTYSNISTSGTYPNFSDSNVTVGNCYQYQYMVSDNAGKQATYTTPNVIKRSYTSDLNVDGVLDIFDYSLLHQNFGSTSCGNVADANDDCKVDIFDYNLLHGDFGKQV